jgi:hypothetical protein
LRVGSESADESPRHEAAARRPFDFGYRSGPLQPISGIRSHGEG